MSTEERSRLANFLNPQYGIYEPCDDPKTSFDDNYGKWQFFLNHELERILVEFEQHPLKRWASDSVTVRNDSGMAERILCHLYGQCLNGVLRIYADYLIDSEPSAINVRDKFEAFARENADRIERRYWRPACERLGLDLSAVGRDWLDIPERVTTSVFQELDAAIWPDGFAFCLPMDEEPLRDSPSSANSPDSAAPRRRNRGVIMENFAERLAATRSATNKPLTHRELATLAGVTNPKTISRYANRAPIEKDLYATIDRVLRENTPDSTLKEVGLHS